MRGVLVALVVICMSTSALGAEPSAEAAAEEPEPVGDAMTYVLAVATGSAALATIGVAVGWHVTRKDANALRDDLEERASDWLPCRAGIAELQADCDELLSMREREQTLSATLDVVAISTIVVGSAFLGYLGWRISEHGGSSSTVALRPAVGLDGASLAVEVTF